MKSIYKSIFSRFFIIIFIFALTIGFNRFFPQAGTDFNDNFLYNNNNNYELAKDKLAILKIDDKTLDELQKSDINNLTFPKKLYAEIIENLVENYGVSAIGIDVILANRSSLLDELKLYNTLKKYSDYVVLASRGESDVLPVCKYNIATHGAANFNIGGKEVDESIRIRKAQVFYPNYKPATDCNKMFKQNPENLNGIDIFAVEIFKKFIKTSDIFTKINLAKTYLNKQLKFDEISANQEKFDKELLLAFEQKLKEKQEEENIYLNFYKDKNVDDSDSLFGIESYSLVDILNKKQEINLAGKIVLIGEVGTLFHDSHHTPVSFYKKMAGVAVHANLVRTFLYGNFLLPLDENMQYSVLFISIFIFAILCLFITKVTSKFSRSALLNLLFSSILLIGLLIGQIFLGAKFFFTGIIYPCFLVVSGLVITFIIYHLYNYFIEEKNKRFLKTAFSHYLSPVVVDELSKNPDGLSLGGQKGKLTIFFSDIEGFTSISEKLNAEDLFKLLNEYLGEMTRILTKNKGTLDKFIGDAVMGFFGAPLKLEKHINLACLTAIQQQKALKKLNKKWKEENLPEIKARIGINSASVMYGNLGGEDRFDYTVIGDGVNLASRLEAINKYYGTYICISESVFEVVKDDFIFRELDFIAVKGKEKGIKIYELLAEKNAPVNMYFLQNYEAGLKLYYNGNYENAIVEFEKNSGEDKPSEIMIDRCKKALSGEIVIENGLFRFDKK
ncbi:MAG: adenylate/guanylate cyclase domain-containing protein [Candidatus Gracilibacteria bacterium]|nr:adenylate/guanylate cyclase domain-containing protein [Candidatus Gracilibacteria bacterium]